MAFWLTSTLKCHVMEANQLTVSLFLIATISTITTLPNNTTAIAADADNEL